MAGITYGDSGTNRSISKVFYGDSGTNRQISKVYYGDGGTNRLVYSAYVPVGGSASPTTINGAASAKGTFAIGTVTVTGTGGTGSYTYGTATLISGTSSGPDSNISFVQTGNQYAFSATNVNINTDPLHGTWQVNVSDGTTNTNVTFNVNWN
ncbi:hypothetical protein ISN75_06890 [Dyella marensis]|uniref:hypothetical protein n=1 Tax=Dyella marensis TaxID=500610 RepID=UPI0031E1455C